VPPHRLRRFLVGLLVGEFALAAGMFGLAGSANTALYMIVAALIVTFIGIWRERLLH
jgi:hypothetical protein